MLRAWAWLLIVDQREGEVDSVVIAGGDGRFDVAAGWVRGDPKRRIWLVQGRPDRLVELGILPSGEAVARRELAARAVPEERIERITGSDRDGWDTRYLLVDWLAEHPDIRVAVLCDRFASRDARLRSDTVAPAEVARRIDIWALPDRRYDEHNWWHSRTGIRELVLKSIALAYTWCQGGPTEEPTGLTVEQYEERIWRAVGRVEKSKSCQVEKSGR